jgi:uncharacterized protein involved in exopolysaccharide biosynthesis/Mrp family chromosome partitioning ATPase
LAIADARQAYPAARSSDAFTVGDLVRVVEVRKPLILRVALAVMVVTALVLLTMPTLYSTSAEVTIDTQRNTVSDQSAVLSALPTDPASLQNQIQILTSRDLASEVIAKLALYDDPEFNARLAPSPLAALNPRNWSQGPPDLAHERDDVITAFLNHLSVDALGLSTSITVTFTSRDPDKAARIANAIVDTYVHDQLRTKVDTTTKTEGWLTQRIAELAAQAQVAEAAVQKYKAEHHLEDAADGTPMIDQQIAAINAQLEAARADLAGKEAAYAHVTTLRDLGDTSQLSQVVASPLIVQLRGQEADVIRSEAQMADRYGPRHPKMIAMEAERRDLENKIDAEVNRITGSLGSDVAVARGQLGTLSAGLQSAEREAAREDALRVELKALESNAASTHTMYDTFVTRLRETQGQDTIQTSDARVISHAPVPSAPSSPRRMLIFLASIPAGLLLGLLFALIAERLAAPAYVAVRAPAPRPEPAPMPVPVAVPAPAPAAAPVQARAAAVVAPPQVLAEIPNAADKRAADYIIDWPKSAFAVNATTLIGRLMAGKKGRVIAVTAADPRDGKTAIAIAFARAAALGGKKVVLIDGDLKRPVTAVAIGLAPALRGIVEVLSRQSALSQTLLMDPRSNAFVLSCAKPVRDPAPVWQSAQFLQLVAHLKKSCDLVVIDAPAAQAPETRPLAEAADGVVMVVARNRAHEPGVAQAVYAVAQLRTPVGIALAG